MEELEKKLKSLTADVGRLGAAIKVQADSISQLRGVDEEKKAYSALLRSVVVEMADVLLDDFSTAIEQKQREKVFKLKELVNPLR